MLSGRGSIESPPEEVFHPMPIAATQLRAGMIIQHENALWRVMTVMHITPGNKRGHMQTKLRNLRNGSQTEYRFRSEDSVDRVSLEQHEMEFLYESDGLCHFMNTETFEQLPLSAEILGDATHYLTPNARIQVEFFDETPIGVELPKTVDLRVTETTPGIKGATVSNVLKPATTETGLVVQVPSFVGEGEVIRVATETGEYVSRVKAD
jgi:elongation factor P